LEFHQLALTEPLRILEVADKYDIKVNVKGGGMKGQAEAVRLAIARALVKEADEMGRIIEVEQDGQQKPLNEVKHALKTAKPDIMRRDARVVERKKPGFRKARKKSQFSKR
jgi:small subunit ribosomal protein S9